MIAKSPAVKKKPGDKIHRLHHCYNYTGPAGAEPLRFDEKRNLRSTERTIIGSVSYRNRYRVYRIESCIGYCCISRYYVHHCSLQVHQL